MVQDQIINATYITSKCSYFALYSKYVTLLSHETWSEYVISNMDFIMSVGSKRGPQAFIHTRIS